MIACRTQWDRSSFDGSLFGIPNDRLAREARLRGIALHELLSNKLTTAQQFLQKQDYDRRKAESDSRSNG